MVLEDNEFEAAVNTRVRDSFNNTTNTNNLGVGIENVGNTDNSAEGSGNVGLGVDGSFHDGSYNNDWDIDDSGNEGSYNHYTDKSDNSTNDNSDNSTNNDSVNAGNRAYNTGFGDLNVGAGGAAAAGAAGVAGGSVSNHSTIVDQSVNANILSGSGVHTWSGSESVVASGEGALAAGDDIDISSSLDASTTIKAGGDVNLDNETTVTKVIDSFNTKEDNSSEVDNSIDVDIEDSGNDYSETYTAEDSFNDEFTKIETEDWDIDADVIWGSEEAVVADDVDLDLPPL